jgi:putative transposase
MNILNKEELRKQIKERKEISLDGILDEFKSLLRESIQTASEVEMDSHLGYEKHQESDNPNYRNGTNKKTLKSKYGDVDVSIPRDRDGTFEPQLVKKRETLLKGSEDMILSLYTKGMSVRDIQHHLDDLYGYQLSEQTISNITSAIIDKAKEWHFISNVKQNQKDHFLQLIQLLKCYILQLRRFRKNGVVTG